MTSTTFPILFTPQERALCERTSFPTSVPWELVARHESQATLNHGKTLEDLASRGGLTPCELVAVMEGRPWRPMALPDALRVLAAKLSEKRQQ